MGRLAGAGTISRTPGALKITSLPPRPGLRHSTRLASAAICNSSMRQPAWLSSIFWSVLPAATQLVIPHPVSTNPAARNAKAALNADRPQVGDEARADATGLRKLPDRFTEPYNESRVYRRLSGTVVSRFLAMSRSGGQFKSFLFQRNHFQRNHSRTRQLSRLVHALSPHRELATYPSFPIAAVWVPRFSPPVLAVRWAQPCRRCLACLTPPTFPIPAPPGWSAPCRYPAEF